MKITTDLLEQPQLKNVTEFRVGDQLRVALKIVEGESERVQVFEGTVIRIQGHGLSRMFTVRKTSFGVGVERTIPIHSPRIEKIDIVRSGHVRRGKLYFLRDRTGRAARLDEKVDRREDAAEGTMPQTPAAPTTAATATAAAAAKKPTAASAPAAH